MSAEPLHPTVDLGWCVAKLEGKQLVLLAPPDSDSSADNTWYAPAQCIHVRDATILLNFLEAHLRDGA